MGFEVYKLGPCTSCLVWGCNWTFNLKLLIAKYFQLKFQEQDEPLYYMMLLLTFLILF